MKSAAVSRIALARAAYDLESGPDEWLPNLLEAGGDILDRGRGCAAATWAGTSSQGTPLVSQLHATNGNRELAGRFARVALRALESAKPKSATSDVYTLAHSGSSRSASRETVALGCADVLSLWAVDHELHGVGIYIPSDREISMSTQARRQWQTLLAHIAAGYRIRKEFGLTGNAMPLTECVGETDSADGSQAVDDSCNRVALEAIRKAAVDLDGTRVSPRHTHDAEALDVGNKVMDGSCSIVDCFDADGRRYILARPNGPNARDPRGLTEREYQVVRRIGAGESCKLIAYTLGVSKSRVSGLLHAAMRKLGVENKQQLVLTMRTLPV